MAPIDTSKHTITLFLEQVMARPDAIALEDQEFTYTYAELDEKVASLARRLRSLGVGQEKLVGILLPHSADFIIACLASLRAGGAYLVLELAYPPKLLNDVVQDANPAVIITCQSKIQDIDPNTPTIVLDDEKEHLDTYRKETFDLPTEYDRDAVAFVSYSSGTTGRPKGIANHDRPAVLSYNQRFAISDQKPGDRIACNTFFIWEMFRPLVCGATAFAVPDEISYDPIGLVNLLSSKRISETLMTPTLLASILTECEDLDRLLPDLRVIWVTGEVVTTNLARRALNLLPRVRIFNSYSSSEAWDTAVGDMRDVLHDSQHSMYCPAGKPLGVNTIYILDESGHKLAPGNTGEIFIGGPVLALGYLNLPEVTAETFVPDPFSLEPGARMYRSGDLGRFLPSGTLEITGRIGSMIKLRGYSIVPAKVQVAIVVHLAVRDCALVSHGHGLDQQLVAYFVRDQVQNSSDRPNIDVDEAGFSLNARRVLSQYLAAYMIPAYWVEVKRLPADPVSGKIDRKSLPSPPVTARRTMSIRETVENSPHDINVDSVARVWAATLKIPQVLITPEHNFFDLGGHSLSLATLSTKLAASFGFRVPVAQLANSPTVHGHLATLIALKDGKVASEKTDLLAMLRTDCLLEDAIRPTYTRMCTLDAASVIFLTGATGFLGAFLLHELIQKTSAMIVCLVRVTKSEAGNQPRDAAWTSIHDGLLEKGLWRDSFTTRIEVVTGDLSQPNFGMSSDTFRSLAARIQVIIHAGAAVNLVYPYAALRGPNVNGTREILRLASLGGSTVLYISTNSVLPPSPPTDGWSEDADLELDEAVNRLPDGYAQTKWVSEQLVLQAGCRGLPVKVVRAGTISGHSVTGIANVRDVLTALLTESIELGYAPEVYGWRAEMTPVDFVSKAIIRLGNVYVKRPIFHLGNSVPILTRDLFDQLKRLGYPTEPISWTKWVALWNEKRGPVQRDGLSPAYVLRHGMPNIKFMAEITVLHNAMTEPYHQGITRPQIDSALLKTYSQYWFDQGWISKGPVQSESQHNPVIDRVPGRPLDGRIAVVTGASSGIGAATAIALAKEGCHVSLAARRLEALDRIRSIIQRYGVRVLVHQTDVTDAKQVDELVRTTVAQLGAIDILVTCAGVMYYTLMKNARRDQWERTVDVNCKGLLHCLSATVPDMLSQGRGHIVAISSDAGRKVFSGLGIYSGSKFFVEATLQSLRLETVGTGLRVTSIQPGNVATELLQISTDEEAIMKYGVPSGAEILRSEDVANAIIYALKQPKHVSVNEILIQPRDEPI